MTKRGEADMQKIIIARLLPFFLGALATSACFVLLGYGGRMPENAETMGFAGVYAEDSEIIKELLNENRVYAVNHPIEVACREEEKIYPELGATVATSSFLFKYSELWKEEAETYAELIMEWLDDDPEMLASFIAYWEHENDGTSLQLCYDLALYMGGSWNSTASITSGYLQLEMNRMNAIKLISLYDRMRMASGWSWKYNWGLDSRG
jgi:hypothetical protein